MTMTKHLAIIAILVAIVYSSSIRSEFVFDDVFRAQHIPPMPEILHNGQPLNMLMWNIGQHISGPDPIAYHLIGLILHVLTSWVVYGIIVALGLAGLPALFGALTFALHPMMTQAVIYVSGSASVLCGLFYFLAILFFIPNMKELYAFDRIGYLILSGACGLLAWAAKPEAISLPIILVVLYYLLGGRSWVPSALTALVGALFLRHIDFIQYVRPDTALRLFEPYRLTLFEAISTNLTNLPMYFLPKYVIPVFQSLDPDVHIMHKFGPKLILSIIIWAGLLIAPLVSRVPCLLRVGIACIAYSPALARLIVLPGAGWIEEHHAYIPGLGVAIIGAWSFNELHKRYEHEIVFLGAILVLLLGVMTYDRAQVWKTRQTIWADAASNAITNPRSHMNLGFEAYQLKNYPLAEHELSTALLIKRDLYTAQSILGMVEADQQHWQDSERILTDLISRAPDFAEGWANLGNLYGQTGRLELALIASNKAVILGDQHTSAVAALNMAEIYHHFGQTDDADHYYAIVQSREPSLMKGRP